MESEPTINQETSQVGNLERKDRSKELMEERHKNAITALRLEKFLAQEGPTTDYPTSRTPENIRIKEEATATVEPILDRLSVAGLVGKKERIKDAIGNYIVEKVTAQRVELELKEKLKQEGKETTPQEIGKTLFRLRTGKDPIKEVEAIRQEGYFAMAFFNDKDYLDFIADKDREESGGLFHRKMRFSNMSVDTLLLRNGWGNMTLLHERQHFINASIFSDFAFDNQPVPPKKDFPSLAEGLNEQKAKVKQGLRKVKDELVACIRDGSDSVRCTDFWNTSLYANLQESFSDEEQKEVGQLLKIIEPELKAFFNTFGYSLDARAVLVYQLIDVPFLRFPEKIRAIIHFYNEKVKEFTQFIPGESRKGMNNRELSDLLLDITGEAYNAAELSLGVSYMDYNEQIEKLSQAKAKLIELRSKYDNLLTTQK